LAKAVTVAEETSGHLTEKGVDIAEQRLEVDKTVALIQALAVQQRLALQGCYAVLSKSGKRVSTGQAYEAYFNISNSVQVRPLTQRRFSDIIGFLDLYGLINARVISKGRYGSTRDISGSLNLEVVRHLLEGKI
jgi:cell division control protein 6